MKRVSVLLLSFLQIIVLVSTVLSTASAQEVTVSIKANNYEIVDAGEGQQRISMEDFGSLLVPGKPFLPAKTFLIAVPPGVEIVSVTCNPIDSEEISGSYSIIPCATYGRFDMSEEESDRMNEAWDRNYETTYASDAPYPDSITWYRGKSGLRKYTVAKIAYSPFTYNPVRRTLVLYSEVNVSIECAPSAVDADELQRMLLDTKADDEASRLIYNYEQAKEWY